MNILILCPDEMKATALGVYGNNSGATPFIDQWASEACWFEQCHTVHPKCTPSRCGFITGQYPHVGGHRTLDLPVRSHETNLVKQLRQHGYETALIGKNHTVVNEELHDTFEQHLKVDGKCDFRPNKEFPEGSYYTGKAQIDLQDFGDRKITQSGCKWLRERNRDRPFFLWMNWNAPHPPYSIPAPYFGSTNRSKVRVPPTDSASEKPPYQQRLLDTYKINSMSTDQWRELAACYQDMCHFVDNQVRDVLQTLDETNQRDETLVIFWSDHGDYAGEHQLPEKWDTSFYDCITRIPLIIDIPKGPRGKIKGLTESIDIMPTALSLIGINIPATVQGKSLQPLITGDRQEVRTEVLCQGGQEQALLDQVLDPNANERPARGYWYKQKALFDEPRINARAKMIRDHKTKYCYHTGGFEELYDMQADPHELKNLSKNPSQQDRLMEMRRRMLERIIGAETIEPAQIGLES